MRRALRLAGKTLSFLVLGLLTLCVLGLLIVQLPVVRHSIADKLASAAADSVHGQLELHDVRLPRPDRIELIGLSLRDRTGRCVLAIRTLKLRLRLRALLSGHIEVERADVEQPYAYFEPENERAGLLSTFGTSGQPARKPVREPLSAVSVAIDRLCLHGGQVELAVTQRSLTLRNIQACVRLRVADSFEARILSVQGELLEHGEPALRLGPVRPAAGRPGAAPLARAAVSGQLRAGGTSELTFDSRLVASGITARTLQVLEVPASFLRSAVAVDLRLSQRQGTLRLAGELAAAGGRVALSAALDPQRELQAQLQTARLPLGVLTTLPLQAVAFHMRAHAQLGAEVKLLGLRVQAGKYGGLPLPELRAEAALHADGRLELSELRASYADAALTAHGARTAQGALSLSADVRVPELASLPPIERNIAALHGAARAQLQLERGAAGALELSGSLNLKHAGYAAQRVRDLHAEAQLSGPVDRPRVELRARALDLHLVERALPRVLLEVRGGPRRYELRLRAPETRQLRASGSLERAGRALAGSLRLRCALGPGVLTASIARLRWQSGQRLRVRGLRAGYLGAVLEASGELGLAGQSSRASLRLRVPDLKAIAEPVGVPQLSGRLSLHAGLRGRLAEPVGSLAADFWDGPKLGPGQLRATLQAGLNVPRRRASLALQANAGDAHAELELDSRLAPGEPLLAAIERGRHTLHARLAQLSFAVLGGVARSLERLRGSLDMQLSAQGSLRKLSIDDRLQLTLADPGSQPQLHARLHASYADAQLTLQGKGFDDQGEVASLQSHLHARLERYFEHAPEPTALLTQHAWDVALGLQPRRVQELPIARGLGIDSALAPLRMSADMKLRHAPGREPEGQLDASWAWQPQAAGARCTGRVSPRLSLAVQLHSGELSVWLRGQAHSSAVLQVQTAAQLRLKPLLRGRAPVLPSQIKAELHDLSLAQWPFVCEHGAGVVSGRLDMHDLFEPSASIAARLHAQGLRWRDNPPLSAELVARLEPGGLLVRGQLQPGAGSIKLAAQLPIRLRSRELALRIDRAVPWSLRIDLQKVDVASLLAFAPGVARAAGEADGHVRLSGSYDKPSADGVIQLNDVSFTLPHLGQRFAHVHSVARLSGHTLSLSQTRIRDLNGVARVSAKIQLQSLDRWQAEIALRADNFPIRRGGVLLGNVDATADITLQDSPQSLQATARLKHGSVALTGNTGANLQPLEANPDIVFASELGQPQPDQQSSSGVNATLHVVTSEPLWVRRSDFAVEMSTELQIELKHGTTTLRGKVVLQRGYVSLLGQSFDIQHGQVLFTGGHEIDPQLALTATQKTAGGSVVRLEVTGFVQKPQLAFFVNDKTVTAGEALLAMTGRGGNAADTTKSAQEQLTSAAIGMTTGLLSLAARQEFGDWVPMLQVQQGPQTRVRVGFDADRLIPGFLKGVVRGVYVEGVVATSPNAAAAQASSATRALPGGGGVLIELTLPGHLVWAGQYGPGNSWSVDLNWRP